MQHSPSANKKTMPEGMAKRFDPEGETGDESNRRERVARISGSLFRLEVIKKALHRMHARLFDRALCDLANRRKRHAGFAGNSALGDALLSKSRHDHFVKIDCVFHAQNLRAIYGLLQ